MWNEVRVVGIPGTECGVVSVADGKLAIAVRRAGEEWPHSMTPQPSSLNTIADGCTFYVVTSDPQTAQ